MWSVGVKNESHTAAVHQPFIHSDSTGLFRHSPARKFDTFMKATCRDLCCLPVAEFLLKFA
jgi:hypothetical protein